MDVASSEFHTSDGMYDLDFKVRACVSSLYEDLTGGLRHLCTTLLKQTVPPPLI